MGTEGFEPSQQSTCFTGRPDSPTSAHPLGVTGGGRARSLPVHGRALWPVSYSHHRRAYPRRASNPRPPVCRTGAPPVELHGHVCRGADGPRTRNVSRVKAGRLCPLRPPRLASGWRDSNARPLGSGPSALTKLSHNPPYACNDHGYESSDPAGRPVLVTGGYATHVPGAGVEPATHRVWAGGLCLWATQAMTVATPSTFQNSGPDEARKRSTWRFRTLPRAIWHFCQPETRRQSLRPALARFAMAAVPMSLPRRQSVLFGAHP